MKIIKAQPSDSPLIARAIMLAMGSNICSNMHGDNQKVCRMFTRLAEREDSQYSYKNAHVAIDENTGAPMGIAVSYDGKNLHRLRKAFVEEAENSFGKKIGNIPDETIAEEYYLDSLAVWPEYRNRGVASALIEEVGKSALRCGKPLGLLVDKSNLSARRLYEKLGFKKMGERFFAGELMDNLQKSNI